MHVQLSTTGGQPRQVAQAIAKKTYLHDSFFLYKHQKQIQQGKLLVVRHYLTWFTGRFSVRTAQQMLLGA